MAEKLDNVDINAFFGFRSFPFSLVPNADSFFPAKHHIDMLEVLSYAINQGSLISVLTGKPGLGKTQLILSLTPKISKEIKPIYILNSAISPLELYSSIARELELEITEILSQANKDLILKAIKKYFQETYVQGNYKRVLLIIDEAQFLPIDTLEELRLLTNLNEGDNFFLQIFLIGQPTLTEKLDLPQLLPFCQRVSIWEELKPFEKDEVLPYIWFRIKQVSDFPTITLQEDLKKPLYKFTQGNPRLINKLMDRACLVAYYRKEKTIHKGIIKDAYETFKREIMF